MSEKILVPVLGESISEATVSKWLKNKGDIVNADEAIVELETDKVNLEVPASISGFLSEINSNAAEYFDPDNIDEIKQKIKSIIIDKDHRNKLLNISNDHYKKYNWENNFSQTFSAIVKINNA